MTISPPKVRFGKLGAVRMAAQTMLKLPTPKPKAVAILSIFNLMQPTWDLTQIHVVSMFIDNTGMIDNGGSIAYAEAIKKAYKNGTAVLATQSLNGPDTRMTLQPNPSNNQFDVATFGPMSENSTLEILDMQGKVVYSATSIPAKTTISVKDWSNGIHLVRLTDNGQVFQQKFIKN
ncbi:MAG: T9SS type A sorting domain-containing protein [Sphingomonadales bacterium]|nr:T9SS type A sorting domain-containing protein [Sphingomonadales bacterium]